MESAVTTSPILALPRLGRTDTLTMIGRCLADRNRTNNAPCLGFALLIGCGLWAGLGSAVVLILA
jgi:hypothetical protein